MSIQRGGRVHAHVPARAPRRAVRAQRARGPGPREGGAAAAEQTQARVGLWLQVRIKIHYKSARTFLKQT